MKGTFDIDYGEVFIDDVDVVRVHRYRDDDHTCASVGRLFDQFVPEVLVSRAPHREMVCSLIGADYFLLMFAGKKRQRLGARGKPF